MSDATALLAAVRAAPEDDAPRLVYADWLEEHGQPDRAEFIRVQCALARRDDSVLRRREAELLAEHHDLFAGPLAHDGLQFRFERGFAIAFRHQGVFVSDDDNSEAVRTILRFHDDEWVERDTVSPRYWRSISVAFFRRNDSFKAARYRLDALGDPALLRFDGFPSSWDGRSDGLAYFGHFRQGIIHFEIEKRLIQHRFQMSFRHVHLPGA